MWLHINKKIALSPKTKGIKISGQRNSTQQPSLKSLYVYPDTYIRRNRMSCAA